MKSLKVLALASPLLCLYGPVPAFAQDEADSSDAESRSVLEEIIVTGRKREESLTDIPVSTSVVTGALIEDAGITDLYDLFEMVPGLHYDEGADRLAALPSIRGIQANDVAPNRTKVTAFVDGIPVLGSIGSIGFNGFQQVEVYRGPQSAAFGRSTFAGAINYVTRDPGEEFEGNFGIDVSDYGTRVANISVGGPITESLGFLLNYQKEDSTSPSEYHATGDGGFAILGGVETNVAQSDGTEFGAREGDNISGKLVFEPDDTLKVSLTFNHVETHDQRAPVMFLTEEARNECFEGNGFFVNEGMMAPWLVGEMNCDWDNFRELYAQHDVELFIAENQPLLDALVADAIAGANSGMAPGAAPFTLDDGTVLSVEEQILLMARAYSIPESERGTKSERDRFTLQADKLLENGSAVQFSYMRSEETYQRANATGFFYYDPDNYGVTDDGIPNTFDNSPGPSFIWQGNVPGGMAPIPYWTGQFGMGYPRVPFPTVGDIEEQYAEVRWVSPAEDRLRYVVGASFYDYEFLEDSWGAAGMGAEPVAYAAQLNGIVDEYMQLSGFQQDGTPYAPYEIISENAENSAVYFNVGYDLTDQLTLSAEGRYQQDKVSATNNTTGISEEVTTKSFVPRLSLTYDVSDNTSYYVQWAQGVNPAGINAGVLTQNTLDVLQNGVVNGLIPYDAALAADVLDNATLTPLAGGDGIIDAYDATNDVWYTDGTQTTVLSAETYRAEFEGSDFTSYDEETITQLELGFKGTLLDGRLSYAGAIYSIDWEDQIQDGAIDLDSPCASGADVGDVAAGPCTTNGMDYFYVNTAEGARVNTNLNFGDVSIRGAEIEGNYRVNDNWDIRAQASIMKGEYEEFCDIATYNAINLSARPEYVEAFGVTIREPGDGDTLTSTCYVTDGNELASQPQFSASISPSFNTDLAGMRFNARLDIRHEGDQYDNSLNFNSYPAATTTNLSLGLSGDQWSATFYVNNLTDENSPRSVFGFPDDTSQLGLIGADDDLVLTGYLGEAVTNAQISRDSYQFQPRAPRTIGLRANYRF